MNSRERRKQEAEAHNYQRWLEKNTRYNRIEERLFRSERFRKSAAFKKIMILGALSTPAFVYSVGEK